MGGAWAEACERARGGNIMESRDTDVIRDRLGGMTRETSCKRLTTAHRVRLVGAFRFACRKMGLFSPCGPAPAIMETEPAGLRFVDSPKWFHEMSWQRT
jgi:hypothetical protein